MLRPVCRQVLAAMALACFADDKLAAAYPGCCRKLLQPLSRIPHFFFFRFLSLARISEVQRVSRLFVAVPAEPVPRLTKPNLIISSTACVARMHLLCVHFKRKPSIKTSWCEVPNYASVNRVYDSVELGAVVAVCYLSFRADDKFSFIFLFFVRIF